MDRKKWKTISQEISCAHCGTQVPRGANNQNFCSESCRYADYEKPRHTNKCVVCNETFETPRAHQQTCGKFCGDVYNSVKQQLYSDEELKHLMLLNRGIGIRQFCAEFSKSSDRRNRFSTVERLKGRVLDIIELTKEWDGLDLYSVLNDPAGLIKMRKDEWIINGCPPTASKHTGTKGFGSKTPGKPRSRVTVKKMKATYARYEQSEFKFDKFDRRTTQYVMVLPEFNWGPYKKRTRPEK